MTKSLTGYIFLNKTLNKLILFPTSLKFNLVYFKIYLKKFQTTSLHCFRSMCYLNIFKIGFLEKKKTFKSFRIYPTSTQLEGKHSEPRHNNFGVIIDAFITPPHFEGLVISCDMIICMGACY